jgi:hypothetical protein
MTSTAISALGFIDMPMLVAGSRPGREGRRNEGGFIPITDEPIQGTVMRTPSPPLGSR